MPSTGAAVNYILTLAASKGKGVLHNAPLDGDMESMYELMRRAGIIVEADHNTVRIDAAGFVATNEQIRFRCSPDRNDAFTWLALGALSKEGLKISNLKLVDIENGLKVLSELNIQVNRLSDNSLVVKSPASLSRQELTIVAGLAREFHSDWAPLVEPVLTMLNGEFRLIDTLYSGRVRQAELLKEMGAHIRISGGDPPEGIQLRFTTNPMQARYIVAIHGPSNLKPIVTNVGYDVRACMSAIIAAAQANGVSVFSEVSALFRGYEKILERLNSIGVNISAES